jgi:hypothetical protein
VKSRIGQACRFDSVHPGLLESVCQPEDQIIRPAARFGVKSGEFD